MEQQEAMLLLKRLVHDYADGRSKAVARGVETPRLAALMVQKYGYGVSNATTVAFGEQAGNRIMELVDEVTERIDLDWKEHARRRWEGRPADLIP